MARSSLGILLKSLRDARGLSLRELGQIAAVDHAYVFRLESGEKVDPSSEILGKLLRGLKATSRDTALGQWLRTHPEADSEVIEAVMSLPDEPIEVVTTAAGMVFRGTGRPDALTKLERARRAMED